MKSLSDCRLYGILDTGYVEQKKLVPILYALIAGKVDLVQLRAKQSSAKEILSMAKELAPICREANIPFILNDHPELVQDADADGAHVGQDDFSVAEARRLAGTNAIIGKSTHSVAQALIAANESPDYIGFGPLFATLTKPDYQPIGTNQIKEVHNLLTIPIFCIGGIKLSNLSAVLEAGARRVAIVSDLLQASNPSTQTAACKALLL